MSYYFSIYHVLLISTIIVISFALIIYNLWHEKDLKKALILVCIEFLGVFVACVFASYVLDRQIKKAQILNLDKQRVISQEKMLVSGYVKNTGSVSFLGCTLSMRLINTPFDLKNIDPNLFQRGFFDTLLFKKNRKSNSVTTIKESAKIGSRLKPGERKRFMVYIKYPGYFRNPSLYYDLNCH